MKWSFRFITRVPWWRLDLRLRRWLHPEAFVKEHVFDLSDTRWMLWRLD